ncbi:hypothetical protein EV424DRAFT_1393569 [Suillus variegatus]|nr:hypothetical protein EV424DRAFT_1393569 [Suillus variegatus]
MEEETKVIHLTDPADPSHNEADEGSVIVIGISPAPTTSSGEEVGIALSSPPPSDDRFCCPRGQCSRVQSISHPYATALSEPANSHARQPSNSVLPTLPVPPTAAQEDNGFTSDNHISISRPDFEKYGVGEVLVFAAPSRDEQESDSEDQSLGTIIPRQQDTLSRILDKGKAKDLTSTPIASDNSLVNPGYPLISVTAVEGRDSTYSPGTLRTATNITSAHLFYRPPQNGLSSGKSSVKHQDTSETSRGIPSDIHSSYSGSALTNLMRSMSEIGELHVAASDISYGQRSGGPGDQRSDELSQTYIFMDMSRTSSPVQVDPCAVTQSPAQLYDAPFEVGVPEDIESSRASSLLIASQENDTFGHPIRQDVVDAAGTSTIHQGSYRSSTYASIHDAAEEADLVSPISPMQSPPVSADAMRSSYMISGSEYSRMSTLSDFPDPPARINVPPNQPSILQIYSFQGTECPQSGSRVFSLESHHTTFGGSDDMDINHYTSSQV